MCQMNVDAYQGETNRYHHSDIQMPIISSPNWWDWRWA